MKFYALDVETANADYSSICQIGIVEFCDGLVVEKWSTLVNPEAYFDPMNISIHGITEDKIKDAPTFDAIYSELKNRITEQVTIHHMPFDRVAIDRACTEYQLESLKPIWLDSAKIVRRTWEEFAYKGYGLANVAKFLGINFEHHDALEDAFAAAQIVHFASEKTGLKIEDWLQRVGKPISGSYQSASSSIKIDGNPEGSLFGENLVFTGSLFMPRRDAAKIASEIGCCVGDSVSKKTTILVIGTQDSTKLVGYEKSSKHRKAEDLIRKGAKIKILSEKDFVEMCNSEKADLKLVLPDRTEPVSLKRKGEKAEKDASMTLTITFSDDEIKKLTTNINKIWDNLPEERKLALDRAEQERRDLLSSIKDCSQSVKREIAKELKTIFERITKCCNDNRHQEIADSIGNEVANLKDNLYEFSKDKMSLREFFEYMLGSIESIQVDLEDNCTEEVLRFVNQVLSELDSVKHKLLAASTKQGPMTA